METDEDQGIDARNAARCEPLDVDGREAVATRDDENADGSGRISSPALLARHESRWTAAPMAAAMPEELLKPVGDELHGGRTGEVRAPAVPRVLGERGMPTRPRGRIGDPPAWGR